MSRCTTLKNFYKGNGNIIQSQRDKHSPDKGFASDKILKIIQTMRPN
jgi:hypothetical protein